MSETALATTVLKPYLAHINKRIETAARTGLSCITQPWEDRGDLEYPSSVIQEAVWLDLMKDGFKVIHHPGRGDGYTDRAYTEIRWR